jgi:hypothetical protein
MVAAALFRLPRADEYLHGLEDLIGPSEMFVEEVIGVDLEKPMVSFVLVHVPVSLLLSLCGGFGVFSAFFVSFVGLTGGGRFSASGFGGFGGGREGFGNLLLGEEVDEKLIIGGFSLGLVLQHETEVRVCFHVEVVALEAARTHIINL